MNQQVKELIPAMVSYIGDHGGYVTKTKLLKLLYLFDIEFYRVHRRLFTEFNWKFYHLGPWTREFDSLIDDLVAQNVLVQFESNKSEYDTKFFRAESRSDFTHLFSSFKEEAPLRSVLNLWSDRATGEILDFVYFRTEPMEHGIRNEPLDFSLIPEEAVEKFRRSSSGKSTREIAAARKQWAARFQGQEKYATEGQFEFTPPRYDDEFIDAISKLDAAEE